MARRTQWSMALLAGFLAVTASIYAVIAVGWLQAEVPNSNSAPLADTITLSEANKFHVRTSKMLVTQRMRIQYAGPIASAQGSPGLAPDTDSHSLNWVVGLIEGDSDLVRKLFIITLHIRRPTAESVQVRVDGATYYITVSHVKKNIDLDDNAFTDLEGEDLPNVSIRRLIGRIGDN